MDEPKILSHKYRSPFWTGRTPEMITETLRVMLSEIETATAAEDRVIDWNSIRISIAPASKDDMFAEGLVFDASVTSPREKPRRALVQRDGRHHRAGSISWEEHLEAWEGYRRCYRHSASLQSAEHINDRGGFGYSELVRFLGHAPTTWKENER